MPFDFTHPVTSRETAVAMYQAACDGDATDWRAVAEALFATMPKAKAAAKVKPDAAEWGSYSDAQNKGRGNMFHAGRVAEFLFEDGEAIRVTLSHRLDKDAPNWERAARCAVAFWRAKVACKLYRMNRDMRPGYGSGQLLAECERYADALAVPAFAAIIDVARNVEPDLDRANSETASYRMGAS